MVRKASIEPERSKGQQPSIGIHVSNDGRFRALDLPPGDYVLRIAIARAPAGQRLRLGPVDRRVHA